MTTAKKPAKKRAAPKGRWITEPYNWTGLGGANAEAIVDGKSPKSREPQWRGTNGGKWVWVAKAPKWALAVKTGEFKKGG